MADDSNRPSKWRRILGGEKPARAAGEPLPGALGVADMPASRRKFLQGAAAGAASVAVAPAATAEALAGAALSLAAPAAAVASSAAADPTAMMVPRALAYAPRVSILAMMGRDFLDLDVKPYSASLEASITGEIKSALDGKPFDAGGTLDRDAIFNTARFLVEIDRLGLYQNEKMRELTLAELSPQIIEELLHLSGYSRYFDARREATLHALDIIKGVTGAGEEETLGAIADRVGRQAMAMVDGILKHPERMPTEFYLRNRIWYYAHDILSAVAKNPHNNKFGLSDPTGIFPRVRDRLVEMNLEEEEMRRNLSEHWKKKRIEESGKTVKEPEKGAACRVYRMDATEREKERGIRRAFLIQPPPNETLTHADILRLCRELKDKRVLDADFRPTAVETQWLAAQGGDVKPPAFGMRVSSSDPRLRKYLGDCAEGGQSLVMPPRNRERTR